MASGGTVGSLFINVKANTIGLQKGLNKARGMLGSFGKFAKSPVGMALVAFGGLTAGVALLRRALSSVISQFMEFGKAMSEVKSVMLGITNSDFKRLTEQAKLLGATTANTATEIANAQANLARAGFSTSEIEASVKAVSDLANATGMEMAEASDIIAVGVRAFGLEASEAVRVADVLGMAASKTNTTVAELGEGMKFVAPVAKQLGFSIEETSAMLGKLADAGLKSTLGGTALRKIMLELGPAISKGGTQAFFEFMSTQKGVIKNFETFGARAVTAAGVLQDVSKEVKILEEELNNAAGTTDLMAKISLDNLSGDVIKLQSAISGLALAIGDELDVTLREATQSATGFVAALTAGINELSIETNKVALTTQIWNGILLGLNAILLLVVGVVKFLFNAIQAISQFIAGVVVGAIGGLILALGFLFDAFKAVLSIFMDTSGLDSISDFFFDTKDDLMALSKSLFINMEEDSKEGVHAVTTGLASGVKAQYEVLFGSGKSAGEGVGDGIKKGIQDSVEKVKEETEKIDKVLAQNLESADKLVTRLQEQIDTFGMSAAEAIKYKVGLKGVTSENANLAVELEKQLEIMKEKKKADEKIAADAQRVIESLRTPEQIYDDEVSKLQKMVDAKLLTLEQFEKAVKNLKTEAEEPVEVNIVTKGIIEGLQSALGTIKVAGQVSKTEMLAEKSVSIQKNMEKLTDSIKTSSEVTANVLENSVSTLSNENLEQLAKEGNEINKKGFDSIVDRLEKLNTMGSPLT
tara:strand:+ start:1853 stop:4117 length:2265 start_codon:yes stop_codon:yes gene_type:complete